MSCFHRQFVICLLTAALLGGILHVAGYLWKSADCKSRWTADMQLQLYAGECTIMKNGKRTKEGV